MWQLLPYRAAYQPDRKRSTRSVKTESTLGKLIAQHESRNVHNTEQPRSICVSHALKGKASLPAGLPLGPTPNSRVGKVLVVSQRVHCSRSIVLSAYLRAYLMAETTPSSSEIRVFATVSSENRTRQRPCRLKLLCLSFSYDGLISCGAAACIFSAKREASKEKC